MGCSPRLRWPEFAKEFSSVSYLFWGTVLDDGEDPRSELVQAAGGPGLALAYHGDYEFNSPLSKLPGGTEWEAVVERTAPSERHLAVHEQHCVGLNDADHAAWDAGGYPCSSRRRSAGPPTRSLPASANSRPGVSPNWCSNHVVRTSAASSQRSWKPRERPWRPEVRA